ncbi:site-specific DNA-methyltransferase [Halobacteria archaeon HArc-gm2]|nr:site-specific DNA-methyltransferase [Halobacteria archaeon HArc-gm2]
MRTVVNLDYDFPVDLPEWADNEVRSPPAVVERFLAEFTEPGDVVLDPFAGFGTTLRVATEMDREAHGVEYERRRVEYVRERGGHGGNLVHGDARKLGDLDLPAVDGVLTSPPWMVEGMETNPLQNYDGESNYGQYLDDMADVFAGVANCLAPDGVALVDATTFDVDGQVTTLAWDLADAIGKPLNFDGEVVVAWETEGEPGPDGVDGTGFDHNYVLVFSKE